MLKNLRKFIKGKKILFAFNDPAGAKQALAYAFLNKDYYEFGIFISSRKHSFYADFPFEVQDYHDHDPESWLIKHNIEVLVTGTSVPNVVETTLIAAAKKLGIFSISFVDHWINFAIRFLNNKIMHLPNLVCVIDENAKRLAVEEGIPENIITIVGNPYYEWLQQWKPKISRENFLKIIGFSKGEKYILYAPEPLSGLGKDNIYQFTEIDGLEMIIKALRSKNYLKRNLLIKSHPNQADDLFMTFLEKNKLKNIVYSKEIDINTAIYYSDCVLGFFSNSLIEANLLGKTVYRLLQLMPCGVIDSLEDKSFNNFFSITSQEELTGVLSLN